MFMDRLVDPGDVLGGDERGDGGLRDIEFRAAEPEGGGGASVEMKHAAHQVPVPQPEVAGPQGERQSIQTGARLFLRGDQICSLRQCDHPAEGRCGPAGGRQPCSCERDPGDRRVDTCLDADHPLGGQRQQRSADVWRKRLREDPPLLAVHCSKYDGPKKIRRVGVVGPAPEEPQRPAVRMSDVGIVCKDD